MLRQWWRCTVLLVCGNMPASTCIFIPQPSSYNHYVVLALAEVAWSVLDERGWVSFEHRVQALTTVFDQECFPRHYTPWYFSSSCCYAANEDAIPCKS